MSSRASAQLSSHETTLLQSHIRQWLEEDVGSGDVTTLATIPRSQQCHARFLAKSNGVVSGLKIIEQVFAAVDPTLKVTWTAQDGDYVRTGTYFGTVSGSSHSVVTAERLALNIMQRMSGIATATHTMVSAVTSAGHRTRILDTRKTAPGLRSLDKLAVLHGGGVNHRIGLYDMVMIKDNHVSAAGGIIQAVEMVKTYLKKHNRDIKIEVEARTLEEVRSLVEYAHRHPHDHHIDRVLLDNMVKKTSSGYDVSLLKSAVQLIHGKFETEGSGNVTLESVAIIASTGVDFVSVGSLTHSVIALDISLKITEVQPSKL